MIQISLLRYCSRQVHYSYVPHANKHHFDIISKIWPGCEECKMYFPTIQSLDSHNLAKHKVSTSSFRNRKLTPGRKVTTCVFCSKSFVIARLCWRHAQREHADVVSQLWLKCQICELHFPYVYFFILCINYILSSFLFSNFTGLSKQQKLQRHKQRFKVTRRDPLIKSFCRRWLSDILHDSE
jgi:hypothetical protein